MLIEIGNPVSETLEDLVQEIDIIIDAASVGIVEKNKELCIKKSGLKRIIKLNFIQ